LFDDVISHERTGWPPFIAGLDGVDRVGRNFRAGADVSVFRTANVFPEAGIYVGDDVMLFDRVRLLLGDADTKLIIGNRVGVNLGAYLSGEGGLMIDDDVLIGPYAMLLSAGHEIHSRTTLISQAPIVGAQIHVASGAWIGAGSVVLPGVTVGEGAVVGAGSVVVSDVEPFSIVAGNPACRIGYRGRRAPSLFTQLLSFLGLKK
jgi:carbonic anhydrase/acetyltransferase-like protein (isoleucine patch superfamily)